MKRNTFLAAFIVTLFILVCNSSPSLTFSGGPPTGYSGAPYEFTCSQDGFCHSGNPNLNDGIEVEIVDQATGQIITSYTNGQTYDVTLTVNDPMAACFGFQCTVLRDSDQWSSGELIPGTDQAVVGIVGGINRHYVQHNTTSVSGEWTFQWEAPASFEGALTMYISANAANCDFTAAGDQIRIKTLNISEFNCGVNASLMQDGDALLFDCNYDDTEPRLEFYLTGFSGGTPPYQISATNGSFSTTTANIGDTVSIFIDQADIDSEDIFISVDDANSSCGPIDLGYFLTGFPISFVCNDPPVDTCDVTYDIVGNAAGPEILCSDLGGQPALLIQLTNFSGDNPPFLLDVESGILNASSATATDTILLYVTQTDIDMGGIDILINDQDFNCDLTSLDAIFDGIDIFDYCGLVNECEVTYDIVGDSNGIVDLEDIQCSVDATGNYIAYIEFENFAGLSPPFFFFTDGGQVNNTFLNPGSTATYTFDQGDIDNNSVSFLIDNTNALCDSIHLAPFLMGLSLEEICNPCNVGYSHSLSEPVLQLNCSSIGGIPTLELEIYGISGGNPPYSLSSNLGTLSSTSAFPGETVTLSLSQSDIDAGQVLVNVDDASGSCESVNILENLFLQYPNFQILDDCPDIGCDIVWNYLEVEDDVLQISCLATDSVPLVGITLTNFSGTNPPFNLITNHGFFLPEGPIDIGGSTVYYVSENIALADNAKFIVSNGTDDCEETNLSAQFTADVIQYCDELVSIDEIGIDEISIYPNPATPDQSVNIELDEKQLPIELSLIGADGKVFYSKQVHEAIIKLDPQKLNLSSGIYNLRLGYEGSIINRKLVIQ